MDLATRLQCHVLYKSSISIHLDPFRRQAWVYPWINPSLSVAGSGDCLAGILAASLCRNSDVSAAIATAMELLHAATGSLIHPESSQFPDAIRGALHEVSL
ncbi:MAG: hypothetical protein KDK33_13600 [Leptospiraceae bacterium]|nr:hypothetical protein [Leptospiraceae bacterium]